MPYKIINRFNFFYSVLLIFLFLPEFRASAQPNSGEPLHVIIKYKDYRLQARKSPGKEMRELKSIIPGIRYDLRYAGTNNFTHKMLYPRSTKVAFLRAPAAYALFNIQDELKNKGLGLKIFDAYRPYSTTVKFWELVRDERYVANPAKGSGHNRGIAVDLTLINLSNGKEIDMGTGFDNFSDTAHHAFKNLAKEILFNRQMLKNVMEKNGFKAYENEWWHYSWQDTTTYEVLDIPFRKLKKVIKE
jgi:D-alanyl-D-alanine dipeptidase